MSPPIVFFTYATSVNADHQHDFVLFLFPLLNNVIAGINGLTGLLRDHLFETVSLGE